MKKIAELLAAKRKEMASLETRRAELAIEIRTLEQVDGLPETNTAPKEKRASKAKGRAPAGLLAQSVVKVLEGANGNGLNKHEVSRGLAAAGYSWSVKPAHVAKTLSKLKDEGRLEVQQVDTVNVYRLTKNG